MELNGYSVSQRRDYKMSGFSRTILVILGLGLIGGSIVLAYVLPSNSEKLVAGFFGVVLSAAGVYLVAYTFRTCLTVDGSQLRMQWVFRERVAELSQIEGYRAIQSRNATNRQLVLAQGAGFITIPQGIDTAYESDEWFQKLQDLDERDRKALLDQVEHDERLGTTPEERLAALQGAKTTSIVLTVVAAAAVGALLFLSKEYQPFAIPILCGAPVVVFLVVQRSPLLYAIFKRKSDPRADLSLPLMIAAIGLAFGHIGVHFVAIEPLLYLAVPVAAAYLLLFVRMATGSSSLAGAVIGLVVFGGMYGWGVAVSADTLFDSAGPANYSTSVTGHRISHGRSTTYYLQLAPWGPVANGSEISVGSTIYNQTSEGDVVCLGLHPGVLHAGWYTLLPCFSTPQSEPPVAQ